MLPANACWVLSPLTSRNDAYRSYRAPYIILAASAFETVRILLNSRSKEFPNGLGNNNGFVGTRILEHVMADITSQLPASERTANPTYTHNPFKLNAEPHGFYIAPFVERERSARSHFGYGVQGSISMHTGLFYLGAFGETVPSDANRLRWIRCRKDRYGVPIASIEFSWGPEDVAMWEDASKSLFEMAAGIHQDSGINL